MITVYLDMDGVIADFNKKTIELIGRRLSEFPDSQSGWDAMKNHQNIYQLLEPMPDAQDLVEGVFMLSFTHRFNVEVLTALPKVGRIPTAKTDKRAWLSKYFPELWGVFNIGPHAEHKQFHCQKGDVLIDDSEMNIPQWNAKGGHGILHKNAKDSLNNLQMYLKGYL